MAERPDAEHDRRLAAQEAELAELRDQAKVLEDEVIALRRKLADAPKRVRTLEERLLETKGQLAQAVSQNEKLSYTLREAREHIATLREEVEKLTQPPSAYGVVVGKNDDGTVDVLSSGRKMRVSLHPEIDLDELQRGQEVVLNESFNVILARTPEIAGEIVTVKDLLDDGIRVHRGGPGRRGAGVRAVRRPAGPAAAPGRLACSWTCAPGCCSRSCPGPRSRTCCSRRCPTSPTATSAASTTRSSRSPTPSSCRSCTPSCSPSTGCRRPRASCSTGRPGCGKTLIAKAVANSLARKVADKIGEGKGRSYFINIKGPELLNKYVGETERQIRLVFQRAREKSEEGWPVIVFFDEMDSMFRTRGSGISSDMESTIVPQLLAEIDGVEGLRNVIVIGATNREDLIDPAILRPGRLDVKIKIERPNKDAARQIFARYLTTEIPLDEEEVGRLGRGDGYAAVASMIDATVEEMYRDDEANRFLEVTYQNGDKEILYYKDFASGAMIENIVRRAKKLAIKRHIAGAAKGVRTQDLVDSIKQEYKEHEDLPNTTNPDDWAKISGKKGERIVFIRTLVNTDADKPEGGRAIERVATGQYL